MQLFPLQSTIFKAHTPLVPALLAALKKAKKSVCEGDVLSLASKVVALSEGRVAAAATPAAVQKVAQAEADIWLGGQPYPFAIKDGILIANAGVDASNVPAGQLVLWPHNSFAAAERVHKALRKEFGIQKLGVIIADSTCHPLRTGVTNFALGWAGFAGVVDERGKADLFGRKLGVTQRAMADALAAAAGVLTGEAAECTPFVLIRNAPVTFTARTQKPAQFQPRDCLFAAVYNQKLRELKI